MSEQNESKALEAFLQHALLLDLEVSQQGKILKLGAALGGLTLTRSGGASLETVLNDLNRLGEAKVLLGHNLVQHCN